MSRCGCDFSEDRITDRVFECFSSSPQSVTYHAQLHGTLNANVSKLIADMQEWLSTGVTIPVQFLPLAVSSMCAVNSRTPLEHCSSEATTEQPHTEQPLTEQPNLPDIAGSNSAFNLPPILAAVVAPISILLAVVIIVIVCAVRRRHSSKILRITNTRSVH